MTIDNDDNVNEKIAGLKFQPGSYKDQNGQLRPCYELTKTECLYIATKFNDEARAKTGTHRTDGFGKYKKVQDPLS